MSNSLSTSDFEGNLGCHNVCSSGKNANAIVHFLKYPNIELIIIKLCNKMSLEQKSLEQEALELKIMEQKLLEIRPLGQMSLKLKS
jgi:hypothetical protein